MLNVKNILKTAGFMIIATLLAKLAGMYRDILFASLFGTGSEAQAFLTASRIPLLFFDITLGAAVSAAFIPVYNGYIEEKRHDEARNYANSFKLIHRAFSRTYALARSQIITASRRNSISRYGYFNRAVLSWRVRRERSWLYQYGGY